DAGRRNPARRTEEQGDGLLRKLVDGHGHDLWGIASLIAAVLVGIAVYSDTAGAVGSPLEALTGSVVGLLRFLVPPALAVLGVLLIRGPRRAAAGEDVEDELDLDDLEDGHRQGPAVVTLGIVLAVLVVAGVLDLLFAHGRTITDDGLD